MAKTKYTNKLRDDICTRLADGESLRKICLSINVDRSQVFRWLERYPAFRDQYAQARAMQADTLADEITDIADEANAATIKGIEHARLRIDARKWAAAKLAPKKYGEKLQQEVTGANGGPVQTQTQHAAAPELLEALKGIIDEV